MMLRVAKRRDLMALKKTKQTQITKKVTPKKVDKVNG